MTHGQLLLCAPAAELSKTRRESSHNSQGYLDNTAALTVKRRNKGMIITTTAII